MEIALLAVRLILAAVFGVAGVAKLADLSGSRQAIAGFGIPASLAAALSVILPIVELAVAAALIFVGSSWFGAIGASALLAIFSAGMIVQMLKGNAPDCHCFGQLHSEPIGAKSLIRNIVLSAPASLLVALGPSNQGRSIANINAEIVQLFAIVLGVAFLAAILFSLRRISEQQTQIIRRIELVELISRDGGPVERSDAGSPHDGLPIGAVLPDFELKDLNGKVFRSGTPTDPKRPTLLFFVSPTCTPCRALVPKFDQWNAELSDKVNVILVTSGDPAENIQKFATDNGKTILLQNSREFADAVSAKWTPSALFVDAHGRVASHIAAGDSTIEELVEKIKASDLEQEFTHFTLGNGSHSHVEIGADVPEFAIEALDGRTITSGDLRGKTTLVTFWSPTCPHCVRMIEEIQVWDNAKGPNEPNLIVFSDGDEQPHRDLGLSSPVIIDKDYAVAAKLGMHGTPSAVLVNENGKFVSEIAIGAPNIWALIGKSK